MKALRVAVISVILNMMIPAARAQEEPGRLRFTVASFKPLASLPPPPVLPAPSGEEIISERVARTTGGTSVNPAIVSPGRVHYTATAREFLANAYNMKSFQVDGPAWMDSERFVLDATMPTETTSEQLASMLRNLLAERLRLAIHLEMRELPMYALVVAKNGPKLKESSELTTTVRTIASREGIRITAQGSTMQDLANHLTPQFDRPVRNETGLSRKYDFGLAFAPEGSAMPDAQELSSIFEAVQSQLGLKLEAKKGSVEAIVVDHINRIPTQN
jgi:uncharacterized protein (TIGR03435 family)